MFGFLKIFAGGLLMNVIGERAAHEYFFNMPNPESCSCSCARPYRLQTRVQNYPWGTSDDAAFIPRLLGQDPEPGKPYAELWMGTHINAPSAIMDPDRGNQALAEWIAENPVQHLSTASKHQQLTGLPYLFKVLSIGEALSIQAHPNKEQAVKLHGGDPRNYPDDNHKPEIAIAIDELDALVGFLTNDEFNDLLNRTPELAGLLGQGAGRGDLKSAVHQIFRKWKSEPAKLSAVVEMLEARLRRSSDPSAAERLFLEQFSKRGSGDIGLIFLFFLQRVHLKAGEAVFLAPGVPHAYLQGNIVECMANSDNVVRLGLTSKYCDATALQEILVFEQGKDYRIPVVQEDAFSDYPLPVDEFKIRSLDLPASGEHRFTEQTSLNMFLLLEGEVCLRWGRAQHSCSCVIKRGQAFVTPANLSDFKIIARRPAKLFEVELP